MHSKGNKGTKAFSKTAAACILTMGLVGSPYAMAIADPGENEGQSIAQSEKIDKGLTTADSLPSVDPALTQSEASDGGDSGTSVAQSDSLIEDTEKSHIYSDITDDEVLDALSPIDEPSATLFQSESDQPDPVTVFAGEDRYDTSAKQALGGWDSCGTVLVVSGGGWPDALGASGLAGPSTAPSCSPIRARSPRRSPRRSPSSARRTPSSWAARPPSPSRWSQTSRPRAPRASSAWAATPVTAPRWRYTATARSARCGTAPRPSSPTAPAPTSPTPCPPRPSPSRGRRPSSSRTRTVAFPWSSRRR